MKMGVRLPSSEVQAAHATLHKALCVYEGPVSCSGSCVFLFTHWGAACCSLLGPLPLQAFLGTVSASIF